MEIKLDAFVLCNGYDRTPGNIVGPSGLASDLNFSVQTVQAIRAVSAKKIGRGNKSMRLSWKCSAIYADEAAATAAHAAFILNFPSSGVLYFDSTAIGTGVVTPQVRQLGASIDFSFSAEIGE